ncbi:NAD-dependent epimerase/dehydratase family protein [Hamadaea tsunoensis]|uniref:NAD-dependent epimerase/dehydratase family protein n=1 Tax=Hamadaea tsunoensis TaxID=53368 RepID=UPI0004017A04|nr:NAD-dependent epimerase/dehydratase family protein [Hamadaea tsunoensis]
MRVAVTGATGFVGGAVVRELAARSHTVYAFGRRALPAPPDDLPRYRRWDIAAGPLADPPDVDAVVHCAGTVSDWGPAAEFFAVNAAGTVNVLQTFPAARFVHVSTASVYDPLRPTVRATEDQAPVERYVNAYGRSKAEAERAVSGRGIILRPHAIYGPGDPTLLPRVLAAVRGPWLPAVGTGRQLISLTSVANLVRAILLSVAGPVSTGVFNVTDAEPVVLDDALRAILAARGIAARPVYLPLRLAWPLAALAETVSRRPRLTRYAAGHLAVERTLDLTAARVTLGYTPDMTSFDGAGSW